VLGSVTEISHGNSLVEKRHSSASGSGTAWSFPIEGAVCGEARGGGACELSRVEEMSDVPSLAADICLCITDGRLASTCCNVAFPQVRAHCWLVFEAWGG
jgi:hypothetical protein